MSKSNLHDVACLLECTKAMEHTFIRKAPVIAEYHIHTLRGALAEIFKCVQGIRQKTPLAGAGAGGGLATPLKYYLKDFLGALAAIEHLCLTSDRCPCTSSLRHIHTPIHPSLSYMYFSRLSTSSYKPSPMPLPLPHPHPLTPTPSLSRPRQATLLLSAEIAYGFASSSSAMGGSGAPPNTPAAPRTGLERECLALHSLVLRANALSSLPGDIKRVGDCSWRTSHIDPPTYLFSTLIPITLIPSHISLFFPRAHNRCVTARGYTTTSTCYPPSCLPSTHSPPMHIDSPTQ